MLAAIFMVHAESLPRDTKEKLPVSSSPFIPLDGVLQFKFKDGTKETPREALASLDQRGERGESNKNPLMLTRAEYGCAPRSGGLWWNGKLGPGQNERWLGLLFCDPSRRQQLPGSVRQSLRGRGLRNESPGHEKNVRIRLPVRYRSQRRSGTKSTPISAVRRATSRASRGDSYPDCAAGHISTTQTRLQQHEVSR
jgi:hypothetical protein